MIIKQCLVCGNDFRTFDCFLKLGQGKTCSVKCRDNLKRMGKPAREQFEGFPIYVLQGYPTIHVKGKIVHIHKLLAERAIGRPLKYTEVVHHVDGNPLNYSNDNLVILQGQREHRFIHARMRIRDAGGDPKRDKICSRCKEVLPRSSFYPSSAAYDGLAPDCQECNKKRKRARRHNDAQKD